MFDFFLQMLLSLGLSGEVWGPLLRWNLFLLLVTRGEMCVLECLSSFVVSAYIEHWFGNESVAFINHSAQECNFRNFSREFDGRVVTRGWWLLACSMNWYNSSLLISQRENISPIYRFQTTGLNALRLRSSVSTLPIKILAKATAFASWNVTLSR